MSEYESINPKSLLSPNKVMSIGASVALLIVGWMSIGGFVETLDSKEVMVIQYPTGTLKAVTQPGWTMQWFGDVQKYPLRSQFSFSHTHDQGDTSESIPIRFNDGGHANISGVVSWEIPTDTDHLIKVHRKFGSPAAIEQQLVRTAIESATFTTGPLMSSTESAAEKRNDLQQYLQDQAKNGPYKTRTVATKVIDPLTNQEKTVNMAEIVHDAKGIPVRENASNLAEFGVNLLPMTINTVKYDDTIEKQIVKRQEAIQAVQQASANAIKAEQDAITVAKQGEAAAAEAKWKQEAIKAQVVTEAEQKLRVAELQTKEAEQYKQKQILIGQGDAEKKRLAMQANGALDAKLDAYVEIQKAYAAAIAEYKGNWVPTTVLGGSNAGSGSGANQLVDLLTAKTARDLQIDLSVQK